MSRPACRTALILGVVVALLASAPSIAATPPREVQIGIFVADISDLDERAGTFTADVDFIARWYDPDRAFTPGPGEPATRLLVGAAADASLAAGWWPALRAVNIVGRPGEGELRMFIQADGHVSLRLEVLRVLRASLDFRRFPFDEQSLPIRLESVLYPADELVLVPSEEFTGFGEAFGVPEWQAVGLVTESAVVTRHQEGRDFSRLTFLVQMERLQGYYVWKIMLPMVIIVMLSWIVFWMSTEMLGRRAGVSSTGMLTVIAYQFVVSGALPRFPYLTVMDRFTLTSLLFIAATMLVNLLGSRLDEERRLRLDRVCRVVFPVSYIVAVAAVVVLGRR